MTSSEQPTLFNTLGVKPDTEYHPLPKDVWGLIDKTRLTRRWSDEDTKYWLNKLKKFCDVDPKWQDIFVPPSRTIALSIKHRDFSHVTVERLVTVAKMTEEILSSEAEVSDFHRWLHDNMEGLSWDFRNIIKYRRSYLAGKLDITNMWLLGDWREYIHTLTKETVRLLLVDPPYGMDYNSDRRVDRRVPRKHDKIENDTLEEALIEIRDSVRSIYDKLSNNAHILCFCHWRVEKEIMTIMEQEGYKVRGSLIWHKNNAGMGDPFTTFAPQHERIVHAVKGSPILFKRKSDVLQAERVGTHNHPTEKPITLLKPLIQCTTAPGELVVDMFGGVASTHVAAKLTGRKYWGTEKVEKFYNIGKDRLDTCDKQPVLWG